MLIIFTNIENVETIKNIINTEHRLNELVDIQSNNEELHSISIIDNQIFHHLDWSDSLPPIIMNESFSLTNNNLLACIFLKFGNWEKAYEYGIEDEKLLEDIDLINRIQSGVNIDLSYFSRKTTTEFENYRHWHNKAIALNYGNSDKVILPQEIITAYEKALENAQSIEYKSFTAKQYAAFLLDNEQLQKAEIVLQQCLDAIQNPQIRTELNSILYGIWLQQLTVPYDVVLLEKTKKTIWEVLQHFEKQGKTLETGLLLIDSAQVANFTDSFTESLGYINRAIKIFRDEEEPQLEANAHYRKGVLLFTWAQNGNIQFYKGAMEAYQAALKVFTQENTPDVFAEIQHHLGVIYSEIPDEAKKKSIWSAVSVSSFRHALAYYTVNAHPYEYATICNHFANALTKFPEAKLQDNYKKALDLYKEALLIRTAHEYPYERTLTLLNYLEACWHLNEDNPTKQKALFEEMVAKAKEISTLVNDSKLIAEANFHLEKLEELKEVL